MVRISLETRIINNQEVVGKECTWCSRWKSLDEFHKSKTCAGGRQSKCKECKKTYSKSNYIPSDRLTKLIHKEDGLLYKHCTKCNELLELESSFYNHKNGVGNKRSECKMCESIRQADYVLKNKEKIKELQSKRWHENKERERARKVKYDTPDKRKARYARWYKDNYNKRLINNHRRTARKKLLPDTLTQEQVNKIMQKFKGSCALTGEVNYHLDHVIPINVGHGGTVFENMIPLNATLNISKKDRNFFEWFNDNKQRFGLSQEKFDVVIEHLAKINKMSTKEYRDYVYWCHENPNINIDKEG